jgi:Transposase DDE domain
MCITIPKEIKQFSEEILGFLGVRKSGLIQQYMTAILMCGGKKTLTNLSRVILSLRKSKVSVGKFFKGKNFKSRDFYKKVLRTIIKLYVGIGGTVAFLVDGVSTKRGGFTKIENATKYKEKNKSNKGRSSKAHTFLMGLLILPFGLRIPFTRYTYYTKEYCRKHKMKYVKQTTLVCLMIEELRQYIPKDIRIVMVADSFFDTKEIFKKAKEHSIDFITSADKARTYRRGKQKNKLSKKGKSIPKSDCKTYKITRGEEKFTSEHTRYAGVGQKKKTKHEYRAKGEILNVSGLGDTLVVFSFKKIFAGKNNFKESFRILLCSNTSMPVQEVIEFYALRWQIEIFFRELKSDIGLGDFCGRDFKAFERFIDLCLLSFLFLEIFRLKKIKSTNSKLEKGKLKLMRTRGLKKVLMMEEFSESKKIRFAFDKKLLETV